jgi:peptidyl-dipeptidase A
MLVGCAGGGGRPTPAEAEEFITGAEERLSDLWIRNERAAWVRENFITHDTETISARTYQELMAATAELAKEAVRYDGLDLPPDVERKLGKLKVSLPLAAPADPGRQAELSRIVTELGGMYGTGEYCPEGETGDCLDLGALSRIMADSRDEAELREAWTGWRTISPPMRDLYARFAELGNEGARELGFADLGALWRSSYDMPPDEFAAEVDRLWEQVRPFYEALHCHVRAALAGRYGSDVVPLDGPIPAHLLGNMWAQEWGNVYDLVAPESAGGAGYDLTSILRDNGVDEIGMVRYGERFFESLGFEPLPDTFWKRSLFTKPRDREVVCHASAWDIDRIDDLRLKMCIEITAGDFVTVHHELGHNFYQRAYNGQSYLFQESAHDGFHEAVGDTLALSVTPGYLVEVGLLDDAGSGAGDLEFLMRQALDRIAFLPFGVVVDGWRWRVFSGEVSPDRYNEAWWELRTRYQGIAPPVGRSEADFDPGAKYHIPANTPYSRYFLAAVLQFQFHRGLCQAAGFEGPLHQCSIYGNDEAGRRLREMLTMGMSRPWPEALEVVTGETRMDGTALIEYFAPLKDWLDEQNEGRTCGW